MNFTIHSVLYVCGDVIYVMYVHACVYIPVQECGHMYATVFVRRSEDNFQGSVFSSIMVPGLNLGG